MMQSMNTTEKSSNRDMKKHNLLNNRLPFPIKLHIMLDEIMKDSSYGNDDNSTIVSWQHHGRAFRVHNPHKFEKTIMPKYFNQTKYKSFQRQLHIYSFQRISSGVDKGAYYHKSFIRNQPKLALRMDRNKIKGIKNIKQQSPCEIDQKFYAYVKVAYTNNENNTNKNKEDITERNTRYSKTITETIAPLSVEVVPSSSSFSTTSQDSVSEKTKSCYYYSQHELLPYIEPILSSFSVATSNCGNEFNKLNNSRFDDNNNNDFENLHHGEEVMFEGRKFFFVDNCRIASEQQQQQQPSMIL